MSRTTGSAPHEDPCRTSLSRLSEHLCRPRQHRGARRARAGARARARACARSGCATPVPPGEIDLFYVGGGQDREQALVAHDLVTKAEALSEAVENGAAFLAVCGGYQLLGRFYRDASGEEQPGVGHPAAAHGRRRAADDRRRPARVPVGRRRRSPGSRTTPAGRSSTPARSRSAESSPASATTASHATRAAATGASTARTCTARCCPATRGSPTGCLPRRSPTPRATIEATPFAPLERRARAARRTPVSAEAGPRRAADKLVGLARFALQARLTRLARPERAEVHGGVARLPARRGSA